jgi:hypothetical protein
MGGQVVEERRIKRDELAIVDTQKKLAGNGAVPLLLVLRSREENHTLRRDA